MSRSLICSKDSARSGTVAAEEFYVGQMLRGWYLDRKGLFLWKFMMVGKGQFFLQ